MSNLEREHWDVNRAVLLGEMIFFTLGLVHDENWPLTSYFNWLLVMVIPESLASQGEPWFGKYISIPVDPLFLSAALRNVTYTNLQVSSIHFLHTILLSGLIIGSKSSPLFLFFTIAHVCSLQSHAQLCQT